MAGPMLKLRASAKKHEVDCFVVCPGAGPTGHAGLGNGVRGVGIETLATNVLGLRTRQGTPSLALSAVPSLCRRR